MNLGFLSVELHPLFGQLQRADGNYQFGRDHEFGLEV